MSHWSRLVVSVVLAACGGDHDRKIADASQPQDGQSTDGAHDSCSADHCCSAADCPSSNYSCEAHTCVDVTGSLVGLLWQLPCGNDLSSTICTTTANTTATATVGGTAGLTYDIAVHILGIVEQKTYSNGCKSAYWLSGGVDNGDAYNVYELTISSPPQHYFLNSGTSGIQTAYTLDYTKTFRADAGATVQLFAASQDGQEIKNVDAGGNPLSIAGTSVAQPYNGQFIQMNVTSVVPDAVATTSTVGTGSAGFALSFAGAQKLSVADTTSIEPTDFTLESWFQFAGAPGSFTVIAGKPVGTSSADSFALWFENGSLRGGATLDNANGAASVAWSAAVGEWHHATISFDHTAQLSSLYVDGFLAGCSTNTAPTYDAHAMLIGADIDNGTERGYWDGLLDETRLFSTVRTSDQIWTDMHSHRLGSTTGLVGEWTYDEGTGQTTADSSGTGNSGTLGADNTVESTDPAWVTSTVPH